jgi:hypothetical protein
VSEFVEECRREWKRLRVPSTIADEMADDLTADLQEAEADGASAEEVLGSGASDPRAFAAAWASERGIVRNRWSDRIPRPRPRLLAGSALLVLVAAGGATVGFLAFSGDSAAPLTRVTTVSPTLGPGAVIGTSIFGANVQPSNIALVDWPRRTVLHGRPRSITVTLGNTGSVTVGVVRLIVQIGRHTYRLTAAHMVRNSHKSLHITLPADLPRKFVIHAYDAPVPGEANVNNNERTWRVVIAK